MPWFNLNNCFFYPSTKFIDDKKEGEYLAFHNNGNIREEAFYENDKPKGEYITYHANKNVESTTFYKNGKPEGFKEEFFETKVVLYTRVKK